MEFTSPHRYDRGASEHLLDTGGGPQTLRGTGGVSAQLGGTREGRGGRMGGDGMGLVTWGWVGGGEVPTLRGTHSWWGDWLG